MKSQRWRFFELPARRPALRMRSRAVGSSGRSAKSRTERRVAIAVQTSMGPFCGRSHIGTPGSDGYTVRMPKRDPHDVLGVARGADPKSVKAAWRRLAREHHPDLTGDDPGASRVATRRMAEINDAYEALRRADGERRAGIRAAGGTPTGAGYEPEGPARTGGPPRPKP